MDLEEEIHDWAAAETAAPDAGPRARSRFSGSTPSAGCSNLARDPGIPVSIPDHVLDMIDEHDTAYSAWIRSQPSPNDDPEYRAWLVEDRRSYEPEHEASEAVLSVPTTSARGALLKMMVTFNAQSLEDLRAQVEEEADRGDMKDRLVAALLVDLERAADREGGAYVS